MKSVGIDIGSSSVKVVEITTTSKGFALTQFIEQPLGQNLTQDSELQIIEFLKNLISRYDVNQTRFCLALRQEHVSSKFKIFPFKERQKILKSLPFELEEDIPFQPENCIYDGKIIRTLGHTAEVIACAAPKEAVEEVTNRLRDMGVEPNIISSEGFAFSNLFEKWLEAPPALPLAPNLDEAQPARNMWAVLHIGHTRTILNVYEGTNLLSTKSILWGGREIANEIVKKYNLPFFEATKELQNKGFILTIKQGATYDQVIFSDTITGAMKDLVRDLRLRLVEVSSEFHGKIENLFVTGGVSRLQNITPYLTQCLEIPVNRMSVLDQYSGVQFEKTAHIDAVIGPALGLAIEGLKKPRNPAMNFLKGELAQQSQFMKTFWKTWGPALQMGAAALVVFYIYSFMRDGAALGLADQAQDVLKQQAKKVAGLPSSKANEAGVKKYISESKKIAKDVKTVESLMAMNSAMDVLKKVNDASPSKVNITLDVKKFVVHDAQVSIEGYVASPTESLLLQKQMQSIAVGGKVQSRQAQLPAMTGKTAFAFDFITDRNLQKVTR